MNAQTISLLVAIITVVVIIRILVLRAVTKRQLRESNQAAIVATKRAKGISPDEHGPVVSPGGMSVAASTRAPVPMPQSSDLCEITPGSDKRVSFDCGHDGPVSYAITLFGGVMALSEEGLLQRKMCAECCLRHMREGCIRCAVCGFAILPGSPVALYSGGPIREDIATKTPDGAFIGCLRWDCCPSGGFFAGHWDGKQFVSAFGGMTAAEQVMHSGETMIISDTDKGE
jgi:hypothetical protein